jgi:hypothetical protein
VRRSNAAADVSAPAIHLVAPPGGSARVDVVGLSAAALDRLDDARLTNTQWASVLRVSVADDGPAMLGSYSIADGAVRFTPAFPFDAGRQYVVRFDPSAIRESSIRTPVTARVALPAPDSQPSTVVAQVYPRAEVLPENLLRLYIEFSAPMGRDSGLDHLELLDDAGRRVESPFLPIDYELWSPDRRRYTVFFDPGRVKDGILPNRELGRALEAGRTYTLVVRRGWRDGEGRPLVEDYRKVFRVGPAATEPLDTSTWTVTAPRPGSREPLAVVFREPLDHGLLTRALGVRSQGRPVAGDVHIEFGERRWTFTPAEPWRPGLYQLLALSILEDVAGNQIGRAFEVNNFDTVDKAPDPKTVLMPFTVVAAASY